VVKFKISDDFYRRRTHLQVAATNQPLYCISLAVPSGYGKTSRKLERKHQR